VFSHFTTPTLHASFAVPAVAGLVSLRIPRIIAIEFITIKPLDALLPEELLPERLS
jgi:hypothetical protein